RWYGPRVIGVVMSGALDDGAAGLAAIRSRGGAAVGQAPNEALFSGVPGAALLAVPEATALPGKGLAAALVVLVGAGGARPPFQPGPGRAEAAGRSDVVTKPPYHPSPDGASARASSLALDMAGEAVGEVDRDLAIETDLAESLLEREGTDLPGTQVPIACP